MQISNDFPLLQNANALLLVTGTQHAIIYRVRSGNIMEKDTIEIKTPTYSDNEGRFEERGPRELLQGSGSVYESNKTYVRQKFLANIIDDIEKIKNTYDKIYLFAPQRISNEIKEALPKPISEKIAYSLDGNFTKSHPTELLEKIKELRDEKAQANKNIQMSSEAAQILNNHI